MRPVVELKNTPLSSMANDWNALVDEPVGFFELFASSNRSSRVAEAVIDKTACPIDKSDYRWSARHLSPFRRHPCRSILRKAPAKLNRYREGIFLERKGEDARGWANREKVETGFGAHTVISTEARPSSPHGKDRWLHGRDGWADAARVFQPEIRAGFRIACSAIHVCCMASGVPISLEG